MSDWCQQHSEQREAILSRIKKQKQAFKHDPANGIYGDCYRTGIACILGIDREDM